MNKMDDSLVVEVPKREFKVNSAVYVDADIYAREQLEIFEKTWIYVGHESEIPAAGDFRTAAIGKLPVILTRGPDQAINVLLNICRHRGAAVCNAPSGNAATFTCPYHRWVYNCDGSLAALSSDDGYPPDWHKQIGGLLRAAEVSTCHGMIFARMREGGETLEEFLRPAMKYIDKWFSQSPRRKVKILPPTVGRYPANWKFQVENTTDGWHARYVHGSAFKILEEHKIRDRQRGLVGTNRGFKFGHGMLDRPLRRFFLPKRWTGTDPCWRKPGARKREFGLRSMAGKSPSSRIFISWSIASGWCSRSPSTKRSFANTRWSSMALPTK